MAESTPSLTLLFVLALSACSTDTAGLERRSPEAAGAAGASSPAQGGAGGEETGAGGAAGPRPDGGAPGVGSLEIVHGIVDGGQLFVCLWDVASARVLGADVGEPPGGVPYGEGFSVPTVWDLSTTVDVELFVAAGDAALAPSCSGLRSVAVDGQALAPGLDAGPPDAGAVDPPFPLDPIVPRRAGSLRLSAGVIRPGAHYALVAAGCTGAAGDSSDAICGAPDSLFASRHTLVLAEIAGEVLGGVGAGLQFLNASRAVGRADLVLQGQSQSQSLRLTTNVQFGAVRPRDAAPVEEPIGVELHVQGALQSSYTQAWTDTLPAIGAGSLTDGETYLLVYVGPSPGAVTEGISPPRFVLLRG